MTSRIAAGISLVLSTMLLAGCGDAGDHFGEFRQTNSRVVPVARVTLSMPTFTGTPGVYPVVVTAYEARGNPVPSGQQYRHPIVLSSGGSTCTATFSTDRSGGSNFSSTVSIPNTTTLVFASMTCSPTTITATNADMATPVSATF
jgi:hypothetical protein